MSLTNQEIVAKALWGIGELIRLYGEYGAAKSKVRDMLVMLIEEKRDPTPAEWKTLLADIEGNTAQIDALVDEAFANGLPSDPDLD